MLKTIFSLTTSLFCVLIACPSAHAAYIKCWKNKQNVRECSETVPPEYAQQRIEVINEQGIVVKVIEPRKTKAQLAEEAREAKRLEALKEKRRHDLILLKTYTTEKDLLSSRDKKLETLDNSISIANSNLRILNSNLENLEKQAANHERSGSKIPRHLIQDLASVKKQITDSESYLASMQGKRKDLLNKYDADLKRYRQLKKVKPR